MKNLQYAMPEGSTVSHKSVQSIDQEHCVFCKLTVRQLNEENRKIIVKIVLGDMTVEGHCTRCVNSLIKNYYPKVPFV